MRHRVKGRKLGRTSSHRKALLRNIICSLIFHRRITTTLPKAKEMRRSVDKIVNIAKKGTLHARRQVLAFLSNKSATAKLFKEIVPVCASRNSGYVRFTRIGTRRGDAAPLAVVEWVDIAPVKKERVKKKESEEEKK